MSDTNVVALRPVTGGIVGGITDLRVAALGTGAMDDGAGCAIVSETGRLIAALDQPPRRTLRILLTANEEYGLSGARAYAERHAGELANHTAALESEAIPYFPAAAGFFVVLDLRAFLAEPTWEAEHAIWRRLLDEGNVNLTPGKACRNAEPGLLRLPRIQHLRTELEASAPHGSHILELVRALHPTAAVCGYPHERAREILTEEERVPRGWYAGPVGMVSASGKGEFWVALRSALLRSGEARLFAGAGIVAGSEPDAELRETRLKLRALLAPLLEI